MDNRIYLDNNATMVMLKPVIEFMGKLLSKPLNPSALHFDGRFAKGLIEEARINIGRLIGVEDINRGNYNLVFTSSGTESNNLVMYNFKDKADIFVSGAEHSSILNFSKIWPNVKIIKVTQGGVIDLDHLEELLASSKATCKIISVSFANNETGILQPLKAIKDIASKTNSLLHSDAVQGLGKIEINLPELNLDFMTISAHKCGGPVGAGALVYKSSHQIDPLMIGGNQERGRRSGTENVIAISGFGKAAEVIRAELQVNIKHMKALQQELEESLNRQKPNSKIIGACQERLPNTSLIVTKGELAEKQLIALDLKGIAVSSGSACSSGKVGKSHVLEAMGLPEDEIRSAIRVSTSFSQNPIDIKNFIEVFTRI